MRYIVSYEVCSLFFLIVITARFFMIRRFPNRQNAMFGAVLYCAIADLVLDVVGSYTIEYATLLPAWINYALNTVFYSLQIAFSALMMCYVLVLAGKRFKDSLWYKALLLPALVFELIIFTSLFTGSIFSLPLVDGLRVYVHGPLFPYLYACLAFYLLATVALTFILREDLKRKQRRTLILVVVIVGAATGIQVMFPAYLLTGVAITLGMLLMFFTLQNPEDQLDLISGVFNYSAMMEFLDDRIKERRPLRLIAVDVGGIRRVNSAFGLAAGNAVLEGVGSYLNGLSDKLWVFRMIGTRFLLITGDEDVFLRSIIKVGERFESPWQVGRHELLLYATVRYFDEPDFFSSPGEVVNILDVAFSAIPSEGWGDRARIGPELLENSKRAMLVEGAVREALKSGEGFELWFQPIYDVRARGFSTAEVLLRLTSPEHGRISPAEFIPVAEKSGLILQIDQLVLRETARFLERSGLRPGGALDYLEVNLSAAEFYHNTRDSIGRTLRQLELPAEMICFEVTETAAVSHPTILMDFMSAMTPLGYRFALDDFGTGYANVMQVARLPFSIVKLDRSLMLAEDEKGLSMFDGLMNIFSQIGLETVVEGVESAEQSERAISLRADYIQGYFYAHPMPESEYLDFLRERNMI